MSLRSSGLFAHHIVEMLYRHRLEFLSAIAEELASSPDERSDIRGDVTPDVALLVRATC
jgi:hypothetical protein